MDDFSPLLLLLSIRLMSDVIFIHTWIGPNHLSEDMGIVWMFVSLRPLLKIYKNTHFILQTFTWNTFIKILQIIFIKHYNFAVIRAFTHNIYNIRVIPKQHIDQLIYFNFVWIFSEFLVEPIFLFLGKCHHGQVGKTPGRQPTQRDEPSQSPPKHPSNGWS